MNLGPRSLAYERPIQQPAPGVEQSWFTRTMLKIGGYYSRESQLIRGAKLLYEDVVEQSTNKEFFEGTVPLKECPVSPLDVERLQCCVGLTRLAQVLPVYL